MSIEENFNKRNSELQQKIKLEIEKVKMGQSKKNMVQLQTILTELQKSNHFKLSSDYSGFMGLFRPVRYGVVGTGRIV